MAIKTLRVFAEYTSTGFVPMPTAGGIDYGYTLANTFPSTTPSSFQTDDPDIDVTVTAMTDFYVWIRISGTAWNPSYTRNVRVYPDSPDINSVVMNMIIATGPAGTSAYSQIVQTSNRLYFNGATADSVYNSKFAGKTYINELNFGTAPQLATVATSGAYADLTGKPALSTVATSGSYADLSNKPSGTAPISYNSGTNSFQISVASASTNGYLTSTDWSTFNAKYLLPSGGTTAQYLRGDGTLATFPTTLDSTRLIFSGRNNTGTTLTKGTVVYINGVSGNTALLARAIASADSTSAQTLGVVEFDIANNATGVVVLVGAVNNLDTSSYTEGVQLYLSGTVAGAFTSSKILAPTHLVYVGIVTRAHPTQGTIEVKVQNGYELDEIHDVQISNPANKDILYHDTASSLWKHASIASVLGYTPYNATNPSNYIPLTALSASAPLSYNNTTGAFTISQANTTTNGFLSSTDWNTFNSKQNALTLGNVSEVVSNVLMFPDGGTNKTIGNLTIQVVQASASTNGFLSSTNWTTFNNKQNAITLTTTGTSGAATLSGATLNIPQYQTALTNPVTGTGTANYVTKWTSGSAVGNSQIFDNGTTLAIGTTTDKTTTIGALGTGQTIGGSGTPNLAIWNTGNADWVYNTAVGSDGTVYHFNKGNTPILFYTNAIERLKITELGNISIGNLTSTATATPINLSLGGTYGTTLANGIKVRVYQDSSGSMGLGMNASNFYLNTTDSTNITINTNSTERMRITGTGNVGIGTTSPSQLLHVNNSTQSIIRNSSGTRALTLESYAADWNYLVSVGNNLGINVGGAFGVVFSTNGTERMRITSAGNVGIGTSSPGELLHLSKATYPFIKLTETTANTSGQFGYDSPTAEWRLRTLTSTPLTFGTNDTERMRITSGGNVGIGTTSPTQKLTISSEESAKIRIGGGTSQNGILFNSLGVSGGNAPEFYIYNGNTNNAPGFSLYDITNSNWRFTVTNGGNFLIGTTSDNGERLYVSGSIRATGNITANSDLTLKKNLKLVDNPIDKLNQLNGYLYQWKENDEYQYGVIAQEVEKILPHAVQTGNNGIKGVAYNQLIPVMIEAIKELNAEVKLLKAK
jgi:hypothetical protein